ncbi:MAG: HAD family hydrolase [Eubacterium sp.]
MIKLIATDLDGTFFDSDHVTIPQRNIDAFKTAHDMGIKTAVASGRSKALSMNILDKLPFLDYLIASNGAIVYDLKNNKVISTRLMDNSLALKILKILENYDVPYDVFFEGGCYINEKGSERYDREHLPPFLWRIYGGKVTAIESLTELIGNKDVEKINFIELTSFQRNRLRKSFSELGNIYIATSNDHNMEISHPDANKGTALQVLAKSLNITGENVMCFGDSENDLEMLKFAKYSFAMENACDHAKECANFITAPNYECGVADAIDKLLI